MNQFPVKAHAESYTSTKEVSLYDKENPYSIWNMVPDNFRWRIDNASQELLGMEEDELRLKIKPSAMQNRIRLAFWIEYDMACNLGRKMDIRRVYAGLCTKDNFEKMYCNSTKMAWMLTPVASYHTNMEEALETSISQLRKILDAPLFLQDGSLDTKAANVVINVFKILDQRVHGAITQKIETKSLVVNKNIGAKEGGSPAMWPPEDIDVRLQQLETQLTLNQQLVMGDTDDET